MLERVKERGQVFQHSSDQQVPKRPPADGVSRDFDDYNAVNGWDEIEGHMGLGEQSGVPAIKPGKSQPDEFVVRIDPDEDAIDQMKESTTSRTLNLGS